MNILIIEDELIIYTHITRTLKSFGYTNIQVARNSDDALEIASSSKIDIVFSDIKIEGDIDGIETSYILQTLYNIPIIFITAYKDKEMIRRISKIDIVGYLIKPYRPDELEALIELAIAKYKLDFKNRLIDIDGEHRFDKSENKLYYKNEELNLTKKENIFLSILIKELNSYVSYELLEGIIWYDEFVASSSKRTFYSRARQKFSNLNFKTQRAEGIGIFTK